MRPPNMEKMYNSFVPDKDAKDKWLFYSKSLNDMVTVENLTKEEHEAYGREISEAMREK